MNGFQKLFTLIACILVCVWSITVLYTEPTYAGTVAGKTTFADGGSSSNGVSSPHYIGFATAPAPDTQHPPACREPPRPNNKHKQQQHHHRRHGKNKKKKKKKKKKTKCDNPVVVMTRTEAEANVRAAIRAHLFPEAKVRTCCDAAALFSEYKRKQARLGLAQDDLVAILTDEVRPWGVFNKLRLKGLLTKYAKAGCSRTCAPLSL